MHGSPMPCMHGSKGWGTCDRARGRRRPEPGTARRNDRLRMGRDAHRTSSSNLVVPTVTSTVRPDVDASAVPMVASGLKRPPCARASNARRDRRQVREALTLERLAFHVRCSHRCCFLLHPPGHMMSCDRCAGLSMLLC